MTNLDILLKSRDFTLPTKVCLVKAMVFPVRCESWTIKKSGSCSSDYELLIIKFRLKLKNIGKITRPFRYDLNQIPYDYTMEVKNRSKGLDWVECLKNYGQKFVTLYRRH